MSPIYSSPIFLPYNGNGDATPADRQPPVPDVGERTGAQVPMGSPWAIGWGTPCPNGSNAANPCGFPNYGQLYLGSYETYRWMLQHPIVQHARAQVFDPIIASPWGYEAAKDFPEEQYDFVKAQLEAFRVEMLGDALRALDYGWAGFEKVWRIEGGRYVLDCLKPLRVDTTHILTDKSGGFAGLRYASKPEEWLNVHKCWLFTHDKEFGNLYGRSRLENLRATAWRDWLDAATDLMRLSEKISGIMPVVYTPPGSFRTPTGETIKWSENATAALQAARRGVGVHLTHLGAQNPTAGAANFEQLLALIKASAVRLEVIDFGSNAPAIASLLDRMKQDEERMFAGYFQSPRTGMATVGGTKADAEQHTDTAIVNSENVASAIARSLNRNVVDDILTINFGPDAKGSVWVNPGKLTDANQATDNKVLDAILADPELRLQYLKQIDADAITDRRSIPKLDGQTINFEDVLPPIPQLKGQLPPDPNNPEDPPPAE